MIEKNAPFGAWLEKALAAILDNESIATQRLIDLAQFPEELKEGWQEYSLTFVLWTPLKLPDGTFIGGLWTTRETPWQDNELPLFKRLGETYAHALVAITSKRTLYRRPKTVTFAVWVIVLFLLAVFIKPIKLSALAPAEVTVKEPMKINLSVDDAIVLKEGAEVDVFLDADPLHPIKAKVKKTSYMAEKYNQDTLAYRVYADFEKIDNDKLRIGLQSTAKIYGERVSVFFYMFRRPIPYVLQFFGV